MLSVEQAKKKCVCRICRQTDNINLPFVYNYGKEYAHRDCIDQQQIIDSYPINREIKCKKEFLKLTSLGLLGNTLPSWNSVEEALADGFNSDVMIRYKEANSPFMRPNIPINEANSIIDGLVKEGADKSKIYLTWMSPYYGRKLNAELWRGTNGLYLNYSTLNTHVRESLDRAGQHAEGIKALTILRWACCPNSYNDIEELLDLYPNSQIEFTAFDQEIGAIPGRNTIVWEVRTGY